MTLSTVEMILATAVSWVGNPVSMFLAIHRKPFGWWIVAGTQAAFVAFAVLGHHWEFGGQALCLGMGCYGVWRWSIRHDHEPAIGKAATPTMPPQTTWIDHFPDPRPRIPAPRPQGNQPRPVLAEATRTEALTPRMTASTESIPSPRPDTMRARLIIAQDAIAALNHFDHREAQRLTTELEKTR